MAINPLSTVTTRVKPPLILRPAEKRFIASSSARIMVNGEAHRFHPAVLLPFFRQGSVLNEGMHKEDRTLVGSRLHGKSALDGICRYWQCLSSPIPETVQLVRYFKNGSKRSFIFLG